MPQLDITTFYSQSFWLIIIFVLRYILIGCKYLPRLSYIIKYRSEYQEERDWTLTTLSNEIGIYKDIIMDFNSQKKRIIKILRRSNKTLELLSNEINKNIKESNRNRRKELVELKFELRSIITDIIKK